MEIPQAGFPIYKKENYVIFLKEEIEHGVSISLVVFLKQGKKHVDEIIENLGLQPIGLDTINIANKNRNGQGQEQNIDPVIFNKSIADAINVMKRRIEDKLNDKKINNGALMNYFSQPDVQKLIEEINNINE